jgi:DNA polymerase-3 subunit epsilon
VKHGALLDAQLLAQVYVELLGGRQIGLSLKVDAIGTPQASLVSATVRAAPVVFRTPRPHMASKEELERHQAFISKLTEPLWMEGAES